MSLSPGTRLGVYEITAKIGHGGMGEVYRARDPRLDRDVAVKVVSLHGHDTHARERLEREARAASKLTHPNIVTIHDVGRSGDLSYFVMEHIDGATLRDLMSQSSVSLQRALNLVAQVAAGLTVAHDQGLVHRDLKPENVMVTGGDLVKILDFGIAKQSDSLGSSDDLTTGDGRLTGTGGIVGTLMYMSPEQARGEPLDGRSDQFAMGVLVYELVTGRHPFARDSRMETIAAILRDRAEPATLQDRAVPAPLQWILERCLSKTRESRYESTGDLARDLQALRDRLDQALAAGPSNVPSALTPLIGRETEVARGRDLLRQSDVRLVTC